VCPDRVRSLILASPPFSLRDLDAQQSSYWESRATPERKAQLAENLKRFRHLVGREHLLWMARTYAPMSWFDAHFDPTPLLAFVDANQQEVFRSTVVPLLAEMDLPSLLRELCCPILLIHGLHDFTAPLPPWGGVDLPGVRRIVLEQSAHHPWYEQSADFGRVFVDWVSGRRPTRRCS